MSGDPRRRPTPVPRRAFLEVLAAAPCALAACATAGKTGPAAPGAAPSAAPSAASPAGAAAPREAAAAALRALVLPRDAEPACVFRAAPARPGAPR